MEILKKNNDWLISIDSEAMQMCMDKKWGGLNKKLSEISFLEFRKFVHGKYYDEEEVQDIPARGEDSPRIAFKKGQQWKLFKITNYLKEKVKDRIHNIKICQEGIELKDNNLESHFDCRIREEDKLDMLNQIIKEITPSESNVESNK